MSLLVIINCQAENSPEVQHFLKRAHSSPEQQVVLLASQRTAVHLPETQVYLLPDSAPEQVAVRALEVFLTSRHDWLLLPDNAILCGDVADWSTLPLGLARDVIYVKELPEGEWNLECFLISREAAQQVYARLNFQPTSITEVEQVAYHLMAEGHLGVALCPPLKPLQSC